MTVCGLSKDQNHLWPWCVWWVWVCDYFCRLIPCLLPFHRTKCLDNIAFMVLIFLKFDCCRLMSRCYRLCRTISEATLKKLCRRNISVRRLVTTSEWTKPNIARPLMSTSLRMVNSRRALTGLIMIAQVPRLSHQPQQSVLSHNCRVHRWFFFVQWTLVISYIELIRWIIDILYWCVKQ